MKTFASMSLGFLLAVSLSAHAVVDEDGNIVSSPYQSETIELEHTDPCYRLGNRAFDVMQFRQRGAPMRESIMAYGNSDMGRKLVASAYQVDWYQGNPDMQHRAAVAFSELIYSNCILMDWGPLIDP